MNEEKRSMEVKRGVMRESLDGQTSVREETHQRVGLTDFDEEMESNERSDHRRHQTFNDINLITKFVWIKSHWTKFHW